MWHQCWLGSQAVSMGTIAPGISYTERFLTALEQRWQTILLIASLVIALETGYISYMTIFKAAPPGNTSSAGNMPVSVSVPNVLFKPVDPTRNTEPVDMPPRCLRVWL